jgi:Dehydrogenases with different specificities (related to short-chain alcohol dehydrogenases)
MSLAPGTRVLVSGGAAGIGRAMADAFAEARARVWIADADEDALGAAPTGWGRTRCDVANRASVDALFDAVHAEWGGLDVLCANAGTSGPTARVEDVDPDDWRACLAVNLDGAFLCARRAAPWMKAQGAGVITLTSSTSGLNGHPLRSPYCAAKWGVIGLARTLAMELGPFGVRANAICPGAVEGPRMDRVIAREAAERGMTEQAVRDGYASGTALGRFSTPAEIAALAGLSGYSRRGDDQRACARGGTASRSTPIRRCEMQLRPD